MCEVINLAKFRALRSQKNSIATTRHHAASNESASKILIEKQDDGTYRTTMTGIYADSFPTALQDLGDAIAKIAAAVAAANG